ncbi:MAG: RHS repeat-associated core domain-containing protein [Pseudomonadota bacterium]
MPAQSCRFRQHLRLALSIFFAMCVLACSTGIGHASTPLFTPTPTFGSCGPSVAGAPACGAGPATSGNQSSTNQGAGNPINIITGNKYQREEDLPALPGVLGLEIVRHYNSAYSNINTTTGLLGRGWKLSYETDLYAVGNTVQIIQADGTRIIFNRDPANRSLCSTSNSADGVLRIDATSRGDEYVWTWANGRALSFNSLGKLVQIADPTGEFVSLQHDRKGMLMQVTDPQGRQLKLHYPTRKDAAADHGFRGVMAIDSPAGRYQYAYGSALPNGSAAPKASVLANLVKVVYPGKAGRRLYHYEDVRRPTFLTGISVADANVNTDAATNTNANIKAADPTPQRIGTYLYDIDGKAILSVRGTPARLQTDPQGKPLQPARLQDNTGLGQITLDHSAAGRTILTNSLGQTTVYRHAIINDQYRLLDVRGAGCNECGESNVRYAYDKFGRLTEKTLLNPAGEPLETHRTELDNQGKTLGSSLITYVAGKAQPAQWRTRIAYPSPDVLVISRPSVVPGREVQTRMTANAKGQLLSVTETGWSPGVGGSAGNSTGNSTGSSEPIAISRTTTYRYKMINGRSVLAEIDGPLANGAANDPTDSDITRITWDERGAFMAALTMPGASRSTLTYDNAGNIATVSNADGQKTAFRYDARNRLIFTAKDGSVETITYDSMGNAVELAVLNEADGKTSRPQWRLAYDLGGRPLWTASHLGIIARNRYDTEGRLLEESLESVSFKQSRLHAYDDLARLIVTIDSRGSERQLAWDDAGRLASSVDALGRMKRFKYDASGNLETITEATGVAGQEATLRFEYDSHGNTSVVKAPNDATTRTIVDDFGRTTAVISPDSGQTTRQYDAAGQVTSSTNAIGDRVQHEYDVAGRLIKQIITGAAQPALPVVIRWIYRGNRLVALEHADQSERYDYDEQHRLSLKTVSLTLANGTRATYLTRYTYDKKNQIASISLPDGSLVHYRRNGQNQVTALERTRLRSPWLSLLLPAQTIVTNIQRDIVDVKQFTYGNGIQAHYQRSKEGALARIVHRHPESMLPRMQTADISRALNVLIGLTPALAASSPSVNNVAAPASAKALSQPGALGLPEDARALMDHRYLWDGEGNLLHTKRRDGASTYAYDAQNQLIVAETAQGMKAGVTYGRYSYDGAGNRLLAQANITEQEELQRHTRKINYTPATNRWQGSADMPGVVAYDASGQPLQSGTRTYAWNAMGNLIAASEAGKQLGAYRYNYRGERIGKKTARGQTHYLYENRQLTAELDAQGKITRQYIYLAGQPIATIDLAGNVIATADVHNGLQTENVGSSIRQFAGDAMHDIALVFNTWFGKTETVGYLHNNHLGAAEAVTDAAGQLLWQSAYDAFGKLTDAGLDTSAGYQKIASRSNGGYQQNLRLPGQYEDAETGLYYNDHRYYDPQRGRYLTPDPLGLGGGINGYTYGANNPLKNIDPSGLILFAFDGTNNSNPPPGKDDFSNVYKFHQAYDDGQKWYMNGVGRDDTEGKIKTNYLDDINANTARARVDVMLARLDGYMTNLKPEQTTLVSIDIVGFSRGAAMARDFSNKVAARLRQNAYQKSGVCVEMRFLGLWDTVAQFGANGAANSQWQLAIPGVVKNVFQAVALNEHRELFPGEGITRGIQRGFIGSHADIGGSYGTGDLSDVALNWIYKQAITSGIKMKTWDQIGHGEWGEVSNPVLHDKSEFTGMAPEDRNFCVRLNNQILTKDCIRQRQALPGGMDWKQSQTGRFIKKTGSFTLDADGDSKIVGTIDMKEYSAWLQQNYGLKIPLSTP